MEIPQISIVVPVYNVEKYLERCIDSILAQTFTDFELLLINDGSKDSSAISMLRKIHVLGCFIKKMRELVGREI